MDNDHLITGEVFEDERGILRSFNLFNMSEIVRLYEIAPKSQELIRGWQGHKLEKKWFRCITGSFVINLVKIDDFDNPSEDLIPERFELNSRNSKILAVPKGHATGIKAISEDSRLEVFSNFGLKDSASDDYRFPLGKWRAEW